LTRTVVVLTRKPHRSTANRCRVSVGHHASPPGQELLDLHDRQRRLTIAASDPRGDLLLASEQPVPHGAVSVRPSRADRGDHRADQVIGQRLDTSIPAQALSLGRRDVAAGGLAVDPRPLGDLPKTGPFQPTAEHLTHFNHTDLPESHAK